MMVEVPLGFRPVSVAPSNDLMNALWWQESRGNPNAVSPRGAKGIGQIMPATARDPGFGIAPLEDPFDPEQNKRFSRDYMGALLERYGNEADALVAYN
jgi:soluble lytic murein transglycosylase-like protein